MVPIYRNENKNKRESYTILSSILRKLLASVRKKRIKDKIDKIMEVTQCSFIKARSYLRRGFYNTVNQLETI